VTFLFGRFELDATSYKLRRDGNDVPLQPKVFDAIRYLIEHHDRVVLKEELLEALWPGEHVNDTAVPWTISRARKVLGQGADDKHPIETVRGRGYRFVGAVRSARPSESSSTLTALSAPPAPSQIQLVGPRPGGTTPSDPFVGRADAMERLTAALQAAGTGRGRLCLLTGDAGIGKTRCVNELSAIAKAKRLSVWTGRCLEGGRTAAFWPWVQVLRDALREGALGPGLEIELRALLDDLIPRPDASEPSLRGGSDVRGASTGPAARFWVLEKLSRLLLHVADDAPRVVLIEDVHWADEASIDLLVFLAAELAHVPVVIVATARGSLPSSDAWSKASARLGPCDRIQLAGLKESEVEDYVAEVTGLDLPPEIHKTVYAKCGGNPLFLQETARLISALADRGGGVGALSAEDIRVPGVAKDVLRARLSGLTWATCEVLEVACVMGQEFELPVLQTALGVAAEALLTQLDEAIAARIIAPRSRAGTYAFSHDTIREALYEELSTIRRVDLHFRVGEALEGRSAGDFGVKDLAYHYYRALPRAEAGRVVHYARASGKAAMRGFAYEEAAQFFGWAIEAQRFEVDADPQSRCEMLLAFATAVRMTGRVGEARKAVAEVIATARQHGLAEMLLEAANRLRANVQMALVPDKLALEALEDAAKLATAEQRSLRIRVLGKLACIPPYSLSTAQSQELSARSVELARAGGDPDDLALALTSRLHVLSGPDRIDELLDVADEIVRLDPKLQGDVQLTRYHALLHKGDLLAAEDALETFGAITRTMKRPEGLWHVQRLRGQHALIRGEYERAEGIVQELMMQGRRLRLTYVEMHYVTHAIAIAYDRWGLAQAPAAAWRSQLEWASAIPSFQAHWIRFLVETGRHDEARKSLGEIAEGGFAKITRDLGYLNALAHLSVAAVELQERDHAERLYGAMKDYPHHNTPNGFGHFLGSASYFLGILARSLGALGAAVRHLEDAVAMNERLGCAPQLARTQLALAEVLGATGDATGRSRTLLSVAGDTARRLQMVPLSAQIDRALERLGTPNGLLKAR
jgi:DNA-binding winged helix-turn-helix (wHTH) protein/tetratricopeptide (TPR) repeat protein